MTETRADIPGAGVEAELLRGARGPYRVADYMELPEDGPRFQLMRGWLVREPSPTERHQRAIGNLYVLLRRWVGARRLGTVYLAPFDVVLSDQDVVQPDILFVSADRRSVVTPKNVQGAPDLVVEVLSPGTDRRDRVVKLRIYAEARVREAWVVDPWAETLEVVALQEEGSGTTYRGDERPRSAVLGEPDFSVAEIFAE
ncbi:Uma2 family endonuclease [Caldinitratiruptor microaerophilus]|uniref:Putative restriction endonuclease domain-containing protein n=1 Tax=Caldinitratiruptor microaerophilus TaxID=671077 RepID=A0AA35GBK2_9FIRM|nr:Uma2 family endonuclease [Caldinitratiruptor microaerophilus]BDG62404.1 hypothetical protein caldi_34940 [Caldinitratiruptor microaerophilus]